MTASILTYELKNDVAHLHMDDGKANALSHAMIDALNDAIDKAESEAKAIMISGREKRFCAGFDLSVMYGGPAEVTRLVSRGANLLTRLYGLKLPVIIACTGHALAAGGLLLLAADYRVGTKGDFRIGLNEVAIGMTTPMFLLDFARDRVPATWLPRATVHAHLFNPVEATSSGFLDEAVDAADLLTRATSIAEQMGALPQPAFAASKKKLNRETIERIEANLTADSSTFDGAS